MQRRRSRAYLQAIGVICWRARSPAPNSLAASATTRVSPAVPAAAAVNTTPDTLALALDAPPAMPPAVRPALNSLDWEALAAAVAACRACPLCHGRNRTVFGVGHRHATLMLIGEAPGRDEDLQGEPFVGRAGQLLTRMLAAIDLTREQVYIGNIVKCRPPNNRDPTPEEIAHCRGYIERQIALVAPRLLLCLGRVSAQTLLRTSDSVGRLRGRWHYFGPQQIPLLVTYHPSYYLRAPEQKIHGWRDLQEVARKLRALSAL